MPFLRFDVRVTYACSIEKQTIARSGLSLRTGAFHSTKTFENLEKRQMVPKIPGKVSRNSGNFWISEMRTIQPKILDFTAA